MARYELQPGSVDNQVRVRAYIASTGLPKTGLVYNSAGLVCYYTRDGAAPVQVTLATQTINGAHSDGGFVLASDANDPGNYRLDLPDAVVAAGVKHVRVQLSGVSDVVFEPIDIAIKALPRVRTVDLVLQAGAASKSVEVEAVDALTGEPKTGLVYNTSGLTAAYYPHKASAGTAITLATLAAPNSAYSSGGFKEVDSTKFPGRYRQDLPDAAIAAGPSVAVLHQLAGVLFTPVEITLMADDPLAAGFDSEAAEAAVVAGLTTFEAPTLDDLAAVEASLAAEIAAIPTSAEIQTAVTTVFTAMLPTLADAFLGRRVTGGADGGRTVSEALATLRNKVVVDRVAGAITVYGVDDVTVLWTGTVVLEGSAQNPVKTMDPA